MRPHLHPTAPPWLGNLEHELSLVEPTTTTIVGNGSGAYAGVAVACPITPYDLRLAILLAYCPVIHRWMDANLAVGSPVMARAFGCFHTLPIAWDALPPEETPLGQVGQTVKRLRGVQA